MFTKSTWPTFLSATPYRFAARRPKVYFGDMLNEPTPIADVRLDSVRLTTTPPGAAPNLKSDNLTLPLAA